MAPLLYLLVFILGAIVGSFLNVVILRHNTGRNLRGRSYCLICGHPLQAGDLIPLVSFLIARGRCRYCGGRISQQYWLVEILTGLIFVFLWWQLAAEPLLALVYAGLSSVLIIIAGYDLRHKIIPDQLVYWFAILAFLRPVMTGLVVGSFAQIVVGILHSLLAGGIFFAVLGSLWLISKGRWIGLGDAKLAFGLGAALGLNQGLSSLLVGFWLGAIIGLVLLLQKRFRLKSEIPFAPFLVAGFILTVIFNLHVIPL